jgi:3-hydroxyisobutyrate dehydrogenase-like beta-hydroxyacid dehydrogenase
VDVLAVGGGWGAALERLKPFMVHGDNSGLRFSMANALKDLTYYNAMAQDAHADHTVAEAVKRTLERACQDGNPQALLPEIIPMIAQRQST